MYENKKILILGAAKSGIAVAKLLSNKNNDIILTDLNELNKDIEKEFSINRSTTSEMLKLMCKKGMIEREEVEYDARLKKIVLTESSRNHNRQIEDKMKEMHQKLIKDLSEEEINMFIKISDKLINNIKEDL